jgi:hypothetical protein
MSSGIGDCSNQEYHRYKTAYLKATEPPIVAIGSSRAMEFRAAMFGTQAKDFYAAGGVFQRVEDLDGLLKALPDYRPRVVILPIDARWFNGPYVAEDRVGRTEAAAHAPGCADSRRRGLPFRRQHEVPLPDDAGVPVRKPSAASVDDADREGDRRLCTDLHGDAPSGDPAVVDPGAAAARDARPRLPDAVPHRPATGD